MGVGRGRLVVVVGCVVVVVVGAESCRRGRCRRRLRVDSAVVVGSVVVGSGLLDGGAVVVGGTTELATDPFVGVGQRRALLRLPAPW